MSTIEFLFGLADYVIPLKKQEPGTSWMAALPPLPASGWSAYGNRLAWEALHLLRQLYSGQPVYAALSSQRPSPAGGTESPSVSAPPSPRVGAVQTPATGGPLLTVNGVQQRTHAEWKELVSSTINEALSRLPNLDVPQVYGALQHPPTPSNTLRPSLTLSNTLQHPPTLSNTLQPSPMLCNALQPSYKRPH